jgi:hypothetical protein
MNEKLNELAEKCGSWDHCDCGNIRFNWEEFAELIVKECARKADQIENYVKTDNSCGDYLKKHFGVE